MFVSQFNHSKMKYVFMERKASYREKSIQSQPRLSCVNCTPLLFGVAKTSIKPMIEDYHMGCLNMLVNYINVHCIKQNVLMCSVSWALIIITDCIDLLRNNRFCINCLPEMYLSKCICYPLSVPLYILSY